MAFTTGSTRSIKQTKGGSAPRLPKGFSESYIVNKDERVMWFRRIFSIHVASRIRARYAGT